MKMLLVVGVAILATTVALAQGGETGKKTSPAKGSTGDATAAITKLEHDWVAAMNKNDDTTVGKILSDEWTGVNPDASTEDKAKFLSEVKQGAYQSVKLESISVKTFGNTAVATGKADDPKAGKAMYMDVFMRQGGGWKAVATQVAKIQ